MDTVRHTASTLHACQIPRGRTDTPAPSAPLLRRPQRHTPGGLLARSVGAEGGGAPQVRPAAAVLPARPAAVCLPALLTPFLHFSLKPSCLFCFGNNRHVAKRRVEQTRSRVGEIHLRQGIKGRLHLFQIKVHFEDDISVFAEEWNSMRPLNLGLPGQCGASACLQQVSLHGW